MFEGENSVILDKVTAKKLFSKFVSEMFSVSVRVTSIEADYKGLSIVFTTDDAENIKKREEDAENIKKREEDA